MIDALRKTFKELYGQDPDIIVRSPGRVNLIGEHTDYSEGFVFPIAIEFGQWIALRPNGKREVNLYSLNFSVHGHFDLDDFSTKSSDWIAYPQGVAWALSGAGYELIGWDGVLSGNVPIGSGLSSSAALELAVAKAFSVLSGFEWNAAKMAVLGRKAENEWVGMNCGIMDQMISAAGENGKALLIDCRSLKTRAYPLPTSTCVVIMDTMTRHSLVSSAYNERFSQCMDGAKQMGKEKLRDITLEEFLDQKDKLDDVLRRRCFHVLTENQRCLQAAVCMAENNAVGLGALMNASHVSLRDDFEVSCKELDIMADLAQHESGCYGARMTGGGFAGSAVALVDEEQAERFISEISRKYEDATGLKPNIKRTVPADGSSLEYQKNML